MSQVYTDKVCSISIVCPPVREIIHELKFVDYLLLQADNPWYNYYVLRLRLQRDPVLAVSKDQRLEIGHFQIASFLH